MQSKDNGTVYHFKIDAHLDWLYFIPSENIITFSAQLNSVLINKAPLFEMFEMKKTDVLWRFLCFSGSNVSTLEFYTATFDIVL